MWALIMTISMDYPSYVKKIATLDNFQTEQACRYGGAQQEVALRNDLKLKTDGRYTFICVKKGEQMTITKLKQGDTFTLNCIGYTVKERTVHQGQECARCESENGVSCFICLHVKVKKDK